MTQVMRGHLSTAPSMLGGLPHGMIGGGRENGIMKGIVRSPDVQVMLRPAGAYQELAQQASGERKWSAMRRPAFMVFLLGCLVSLVTAGALSPRLFAAGALNALFVPLLEIGVLAGVWRSRRATPFSRTVDLFFMGHGPWVLWLLVMCAIWVFASPSHAFFLTGRGMWFLLGVVALWSGYIDFCFLRYVLKESAKKAVGSLVILRVITWSVGLVIFGGGSLWPEMVRVLRL